ncbi:MAG: DUF1549 and DUF1553 domain-containing protein, partial [Planctomycetia bacterium]|nr:DUF1549 and DUF1553 domain-containing protein [Planctomycetia bacterium]
MPRCRFRWLLAVIVLVASGGLRPPLAKADEPLRAVIDKEITAAWKAQNISPAAKSTDAEFLRRVYIDLVGTVPTFDETTKFLADTDEKKREKLIDKLLADPRFALAQANVWDLALFGRRPGNISETRVRPAFKTWLAKQFADGVPHDKLVKELLLAEQPGSEMFMVQFRNAPEEAAVNVSRLFLGTQLQCARCHDHPYDVWTQKDFYGVAGFFVRLVVQDSGSGNNRKFTIGEKNSGEVLFSGAAKDLTPGKKGDPVKPKFLGGKELDEPPLPKGYKELQPKSGQKLPKPKFSRKEKFAEWVTSADNAYFAKATVNRVWAQFMGRGLVHPIDDFQKENFPSHPALLQALTEGFVAHKFDLKWLIREIVNSDAYQLSGTGSVKDALPKWFERARVRPLTAEEIVAAMRTASGTEIDPKNPNPNWEYFLRAFGEPTNGLGEFQGSLSEHLFLNNSDQVRSLFRRKKGNLADQILTSTEPWEKRVERMYLSILNRPPKPKELEAFVSFIKREPKPDAAVEDAIWVLLNSSEF